MASSAATRDKQVAIHDSESHRPRNSARPSRHDWPDFSTSPRSRPIAIELPPPRKPSTASVDTPPEPLSARGDVIGGYFPLHENPTCSKLRLLATNATRAWLTEHYGRIYARSQGIIAFSVHENALPMGKYYPSNYEASRRSQHSQLPSPAPNTNAI
ncbi:hypothetical protein P8C59_001099 [Phyllachora maydis]|uniref:Uncharacterized protein n=1 Tax=Phyllachora maydis TaxID=1825666 RepID=A0AAD9M7F5_9PEZI|nr:hypothetical protein P8C59_001099 [Phyllachora maydis]